MTFQYFTKYYAMSNKAKDSSMYRKKQRKGDLDMVKANFKGGQLAFPIYYDPIKLNGKFPFIPKI